MSWASQNSCTRVFKPASGERTQLLKTRRPEGQERPNSRDTSSRLHPLIAHHVQAGGIVKKQPLESGPLVHGSSANAGRKERIQREAGLRSYGSG